MSYELKPCPFCGGDAEFERIGNSRKSTIVCCTECGVSQECGEEWDHGRTWNTRHIPEGFALVSVEPTESMMNSAYDVFMDSSSSDFDDLASAMYKAMITVAQEEMK